MTLKIKRLDRHGIVAGVIDELNMVPLLDKHLPQDDKQEITPDEAIKSMIMNGHSKAHRPDLKQVVQEMIVSQDGEDCQSPSYLVTDCKFYHY
jgi:hypothetical protein